MKGSVAAAILIVLLALGFLYIVNGLPDPGTKISSSTNR